jgi:anthranilate phosphoribosyltransferase
VIYGETERGKPLGEASPRGLTLWKDSGGTEIEAQELPGDETSDEWTSLQVLSSRESAAHIVSLLDNQGPPLAQKMLRLNAAHAFCAQGASASLEEGLLMAEESLISGSAKGRLKQWQSF